MLLISLPPLTARKVLLFVAGLIGVSSAACFAQTGLLTVATTPYDRQMERIQPVLSSKPARKADPSLAMVNQWMGNLRAIPYGFSPEWKTPGEVRTDAVADCKGKAVALYQKMNACGAENVRLVIGRRIATSRKTHAWLEWVTNGNNFVLDPTINWAAARVENLGTRSYIPLYAYAGTRKYRAAPAALYAKN